MIEIKNLTKFYDSLKAVDNLSFEIQKGEVVGFLGPNGAGKTTTLKMMSGVLQPTTGSLSIFGVNMAKSPKEAKQKIGYLSEKNPLYEEYSVEQYLYLMAQLKTGKKNKKEIDEIVEKTFISSVLKKTIHTLSKGYKQRVGLATSLLGHPELLLLDEPTVGLDPNQIIDIRRLIKSLGETTTILLSTHILQEVNSICDKVIIINEGKLVAIDSPDNLAYQLAGQNRLFVKVIDFEEQIVEKLKQISGIDNIEVTHKDNFTILNIFVQADKMVQNDIASILLSHNVKLVEMKFDKLSLESIFQKLTKGNDNE